MAKRRRYTLEECPKCGTIYDPDDFEECPNCLNNQSVINDDIDSIFDDDDIDSPDNPYT